MQTFVYGIIKKDGAPMKAIIREKTNGEMVVQYNRIANLTNFRYCLLKSILASTNDDITLFIDTNQRIASKPMEQLESFFEQMQLHYVTARAESNPKQFFGLTLPRNKKQPLREYKIALELPDNTFSREMFDTLKSYDLSFGFGKNKTFEALFEDYKLDNGLVVFNTECFKQSLYDSAVCECLRSSFDIDQFVRKAENEITI
jgi:hypothetical protein